VGERTAWGARAVEAVAHTPKLSPSPLPPLPLIGGQAARAVKGLDRWGNGRHGGSGGGAFVAHTPKSSPSMPPPPPLIGGQAARTVEGLDRWGNGWHGGPKRWRRVRRPHTEVVTVDATTAATHRWTGGARGRGVGPVGERTAWGARAVEAYSSPTHRSRRRRRRHRRHS
jgi:hypothetical protein